MEKVYIHTEYIELDSLLKWANIAMTGGQAKQMIKSGMVLVNGVVETRRKKKIYPGDRVEIAGGPVLIVEAEER
ncbi:MULTISPECIES: S4 domain-containing protein YaaA [Carboxydothermus]|uniref:S4 domain protein n=2 Tax=Carboxydothermus TaxID=129957 RepID=Q3A8P4_CARHZ|nr:MULTISPECIES: S4 domain-containing protein YaaA [Carboxydothermus]ABB15762.1 S4 domain protein [Carboxydothermus hydrogenoformans Z-2901]NYE57602.1 ribosome-associated protein [Carboxydothermus ferrireducens DSM 11255]